ncbi:unnamed protein product [Camellia sinensis]
MFVLCDWGWCVSADQFTKYFGKYGEITDSVIMKDWHTGRPRGFGFITYADPSVVDTVIAETHVTNDKQVLFLTWVIYFGRKIFVHFVFLGFAVFPDRKNCGEERRKTENLMLFLNFTSCLVPLNLKLEVINIPCQSKQKLTLLNFYLIFVLHKTSSMYPPK